MKLAVRDFIYMDVDRLKSIIAQLEQGLPASSSEATTSSRQVDASLSVGLIKFLEAAGGTQFLWQRQQSETRTLHDNIYNRVERLLLDAGLLTSVPGDVSPRDVESESHLGAIGETSFLLAKGKVAINDFGAMRSMFERFNELGKFLAQASAQNLPDGTSKQDRRQFIQKKQKDMRLDPDMLDGFKLVFDMFYSDRIVLKLTPFPDYPDFRFVGNLESQNLRDSISSITYKYGTAPASPWFLFAQVASKPPKQREEVESSITGGEIEVALQGMFDATRGFEKMVQSVDYPEIAVTPIALYRE